ncbi:MAG: hypothetical protein GY737_22950 [Desulfobacteraceae bacterium]|nr:hypothetical protein [Desulfobacteraceae bacterium]
MENEFLRIKKTLKKLDELHMSHFESFDNDSVPDLEEQSAERETEVENLKESISRFLTMAEIEPHGDAEAMMLFLNNRITNLLEQNNALEIKVVAYREKIRNSMKQISRGKQAIGSYGSSAGLVNKPKVISLTK